MKILKKTERDESGLYLRVPDSGRTWCVQYDDIRRIPRKSIKHGDVLIVRNGEDDNGVMFMQAVVNKSGKVAMEDVGRPAA